MADSGPCGLESRGRHHPGPDPAAAVPPEELNFPPGARYLYSNAGFTLLAEIVARASGKTFTQFCADRIFGPLGMGHAHSYGRDGHGAAAAPANSASGGATSPFTTADDLVVGLDKLRDPQGGGAAAVAREHLVGVRHDGTKGDYGLGIELGKYRGLPTI